MTNDIVARLRDIEGGYGFRAICREAADEIERLRELSGESGQLREERDEARREILESMHPDLRKSYAAARGWEFLKDAP